MHLVKWFRRNMTKLMAIFVILIMIAFIMPTVLNQLAKPKMRAGNAMWLYGKDSKISIEDVRQATAELAVLRGLYVDRFLMGQQDLKLLLLGQVLFPEPQQSAMLSDELKKLSLQGRLYLGVSKINDFFSQTRGRSELFWILLKNEARQAGCTVLPDSAAVLLNRLISQITNNQLDAATAVNRVCLANNMTESQALAAFADVMSVVIYARIVGDSEDVTEPQLENVFARAKETINAEFVQFSADDFLDEVSEPGESQISAQFEKYKNYLPGELTDDNPYGFGYKIMPRAAVDYIIVKLDDVKKLIDRPTEEEAEEYYQRNLERFTERLSADVNDQSGEPVIRQKSYAEVANSIKAMLYTQKTGAHCTKILNRAVELAEAGFGSLDFEKASLDEFRNKAGDYAVSTEAVSKEYGIKFYTGRTGLLTAEQMQSDRYLGTLLMAGQNRMPVRLVRLAFAVSPLGDEASKLGPFEPPAPKMYVSFGPLAGRDGDIMAMVRVVETAGSMVPENIEFSYQKNLPEIFEPAEAGNKSFILKDVVAKDCKRLEAMKIARKTAEDFLETTKKQSWESALQKLDASSGKKDAAKKTHELQTWNDRTRVSQMEIEMAKTKTAGLTGAGSIVKESISYAELINIFYQKSLDIQAAKEELPLIIDFEPQLSCYAVKNLTCDFGTIEEYEAVRPELAFQQDYVISQSMAIEHFMPDNVMRRLNFRPAQTPEKSADSNDINGEN